MMNNQVLNNQEKCDIIPGVTKVRLPGAWAKFLRRMMGLQDGQYLLSFEIVDGKINTWREFVGGKAEQ